MLDVTDWRKKSPILDNIVGFIHVDSHVRNLIYRTTLQSTMKLTCCLLFRDCDGHAAFKFRLYYILPQREKIILNMHPKEISVYLYNMLQFTMRNNYETTNCTRSLPLFRPDKLYFAM